MKVLIDTNVLISAAIFDAGTSSRAVAAALDGADQALVCNYSIDEMAEVLARKFPQHLPSFPQFQEYLAAATTVVETPTESQPGELVLRDPDDLPILRAALAAGASLIITGDKDFLEAELVGLKAISPADYLRIAAR